jgi:hypothetical protein
LFEPGWASTPSKRRALSLTDEHLLSIPEDALWSEDHEQHQTESDESEADVAHVGDLEAGEMA